MAIGLNNNIVILCVYIKCLLVILSIWHHYLFRLKRYTSWFSMREFTAPAKTSIDKNHQKFFTRQREMNRSIYNFWNFCWLTMKYMKRFKYINVIHLLKIFFDSYVYYFCCWGGHDAAVIVWIEVFKYELSFIKMIFFIFNTIATVQTFAENQWNPSARLKLMAWSVAQLGTKPIIRYD